MLWNHLDSSISKSVVSGVCLADYGWGMKEAVMSRHLSSFEKKDKRNPRANCAEHMEG